MLIKVVEYVVKTLADEPGQVTVTEVQQDDKNIIEIRAHEGDIGKIIGKDGKTIRALRGLISVLSLSPSDKETIVDVFK